MNFLVVGLVTPTTKTPTTPTIITGSLGFLLKNTLTLSYIMLKNGQTYF